MMWNHYSTKYRSDRWKSGVKEFAACDYLTDSYTVYTANLDKVDCWNCRNTKAFKEALTTLEVGFDGCTKTYEDFLKLESSK